MRGAELELDADDVVDAAVAIFEEGGLDAVSMRSVASRLGVSPVPLYARVGNKGALLEAVAERLLADLAPALGAHERWDAYARRWAGELRARLRRAKESRLILSVGRPSFVEASRPLIEVMRRDGFGGELAVRSCRLLMWAVVGFVLVETGADPEVDADALFDLELAHLVDGIVREHEGAR